MFFMPVMLLLVSSHRRVRLVFFNKTETDIPWKEEMQKLVANNEEIFQV